MAPEPRYKTGSFSTLTGMLGLLTLGLGLFAFRDLGAHDPFEAGRGATRELEDWFFRPAGVSPQIIAGVALWLAYARRRALRAAVVRQGPTGFGWLLLVPAVPLYAWSRYVQIADLQLIAAVLVILGAGSLLGGRKGIRALLFPGLFALLLVPAPAVLVNAAIYPMQLATAESAGAILRLVGTGAVVSAEMITTPTDLFRVIETCAGIGITANLLMASILYGEIFFRSGLQSALLVLLSPLVAWVTNIGRVLTIIANPLASIAEVHAAQGLAMIAVGVLLLAPLDALLTRILPAPAAVTPPPGGRHRVRPRRERLARLGRVALVLSVFSLISVTVEPWKPPPNMWRPPSQIPFTVGDWTGRLLKLDPYLMGSVVPRGLSYRTYERDGESLTLFAADDNRLVRRSSLISPKTALPSMGFAEIRRERRVIDVVGEVDVILFARGAEQMLVYHWTDGAEGTWTEAAREFVGLDRSPLRRADRLFVWRLGTPIGPTEADRQAADERLADFVVELKPTIEKLRTPVNL